MRLGGGDMEERLAECFRLFDETGDVARCLARYPDLSDELTTRLDAFGSLSAMRPPEPPSLSQSSSRRVLQSSLAAEQQKRRGIMGGLAIGRVAGALAVLTLLAVGAMGASAASGGVNSPGRVNDVLSAVGITEHARNHGSDVSESVHEAIEATEPGPERGIAVSEAACEAAHDMSTLPEGAQNAPGQEGREPKDCAHPNADGTPGAGEGAGKPETTGKPESAGVPACPPSRAAQGQC